MNQNNLMPLIQRFDAKAIDHIKTVLAGFQIDWESPSLQEDLTQWYLEFQDQLDFDEGKFKPKKGFAFLISPMVWDQVSKDYASLVDYWGWFGEKLVDFAEIKPEDSVLDIGFGRGASLLKAAEISREVTGIEASSGMVYYTSKVAPKHVTLVHATADGFNYGMYDRILCGFGLGYLMADDLLPCIKYSLKAKGSFVMATWAHQTDQDWISSIVEKYTQMAPQERSPLTTPKGLKKELKRHFKKIDMAEVSETFYFESPEAWWQDLNYTAVKNIIDKVAPEDLAAFKAEMLEGVKQYQTPQGIGIKRDAILVRCS